MHKVGALLIVFLSLSLTSFCQKITMVKTFGGTRFQLDTLTISPNQVLDLLKDDPLAYKEFKRGKANYSASGVVGFTGGLLVGFPVGTALGGGKPEWGIAAVGGALILISIPFSKAFHHHAQNALDEYNKKLPTSRIRSNVYLSGTGARLIIRF